MRKIVDVAVLMLLVAIIIAIAYIFRKAGTCMIILRWRDYVEI